MNKRDEDQSQDSSFGIPQYSNHDGRRSSNNILSTSSPTNPPGFGTYLMASPSKGLDLGYIIVIIFAVAIAIFFIMALIYILILSSRIQKSMRRNESLKLNGRPQSGSTQYHSQWNEKLDMKSLPPIPDPAYFSNDIRASDRRMSEASGYSESRYSRSMSFDSGVGWGGDEEEGYAKSFIGGESEWDEKSSTSIARSAMQERESKYDGIIGPEIRVGKYNDEEKGDWYSMYEELIYTDEGREIPNPDIDNLTYPSQSRDQRRETM